MAVKSIYRQTWQKTNGWNVRVDFVPAGGDASDYGSRTVVPISGVFKKVSDHVTKFDKYPIGVQEAQTCKFVIDYENCPTVMKDAIDVQSVTLTGSESGYTSTAGYTDQAGFVQPNFFVVWSDRGTDTGAPLTVTITDDGGSYTSGAYATTAVYPSVGTGLVATIVAADGAVADGVVVSPGSGYSGTHTAPTTGGTGTGLVLDIDVNGSGELTTVTIRTAGTGYVIGDVVTVTGGDGMATYQVTDADNSGAILSVTLAGGVNYQVGDTVQIPGGSPVGVFTIATIATPTYTPEFIGCQRILPSEKYKETATGLEVEIDAVGIHKIAQEFELVPHKFMQALYNWGNASSNLPVTTQATTVYGYQMSTAGDSSFGGIPYITLKSQHDARWMYMVNMSQFWIAYNYIVLERYKLLTGNGNPSLWLGFFLLMDAANVKFYKNNTSTYHNVYVQGTEIGFSDLYFIAGTSYINDLRALETRTYGLFGLLTSDKDGITAKAKTGWDLLKQSCEQFFVKATAIYGYSGGKLGVHYNIDSPYGSTYTEEEINYNAGKGVPEFERNRDRITGKAKVHFLALEDDISEWESYTGGKSEDGFELEAIWCGDYVTQTSTFNNAQAGKDGYGFNPSVAGQYCVYHSLLNLRGLYYLSSGVFTQISPRFQLKPYPEASFTADPTIADAAGVPVPPNATGSQHLLKHIMDGQDAQINFKRIAATYVDLFGTQNSQTGYDMELELTANMLADRVGHRVDITPHTAMSSVIATKSIMVENVIDWSANAGTNYSKCKFLTRVKEYD